MVFPLLLAWLFLLGFDKVDAESYCSEGIYGRLALLYNVPAAQTFCRHQFAPLTVTVTDKGRDRRAAPKTSSTSSRISTSPARTLWAALPITTSSSAKTTPTTSKALSSTTQSTLTDRNVQVYSTLGALAGSVATTFCYCALAPSTVTVQPTTRSKIIPTTPSTTQITTKSTATSTIPSTTLSTTASTTPANTPSTTTSATVSTTTTSAALATNGQPCILGEMCASGYCNVDQRICAATNLKDDSPCRSKVQCVSNYCSSSGTCGKKDVAGACSTDEDCSSSLCDTTGKKCLPVNQVDGLPCVRATQCQSKQCINNQCGSVQDGGHCINGDQCLSGFCDSANKCITKKADGKDCESAEQCITGHCNTKSAKCGKGVVGSLCGMPTDCTSDLCTSIGVCGIPNQVDGSPCADAAECVTGYCNSGKKCGSSLKDLQACSSARDCTSGVCRSPGVCGKGGTGESCADAGECVSGVCKANTLLPGSSCVLKDGYPCKSNTDCDTFCNSQTRCGKLNGGEKCVTSEECMDGYCSQASKLCDKLNKADGDACAYHFECALQHCNQQNKCGSAADGVHCVDAQDCKSGICNSAQLCGLAKDGLSCFDQSECQGGHCNAGQCSDVSYVNGDTCDLNRQCLGGVCNAVKRCGKLPDGQACQDATDCSSGLCNSIKKCGRGTNGDSCTVAGDCVSDYCSSSSCASKPLLDGQSCLTPNQCASNFCTNAKCGKAGQGENCVSVSECSTKYCITSKCTDALVAKGGVCTADADCLSGLCATGVCKIADGNSCTADMDCKSNVCTRAGLCGQGTAGSSCARNIECDSGNCLANMCRGVDGSKCDRDSWCQSNICNAGKTCGQGKIGNACSRAFECGTGTTCKDNVCKGLNGVACAADANCVIGICNAAGTCGKLPLASPCNRNSECSSEKCVGGTCRIPSGSQGCNRNDALCEHNVCNYALNFCGLVASGSRCSRTYECAGSDCIDSICKVAVGGGCGSGSQCVTGVCSGNRCV